MKVLLGDSDKLYITISIVTSKNEQMSKKDIIIIILLVQLSGISDIRKFRKSQEIWEGKRIKNKEIFQKVDLNVIQK